MCLLTADMGKSQISVLIPDINEQYLTHVKTQMFAFTIDLYTKDLVTTDLMTLDLVTKLEA